ncbi:MAG: DUF192 domain-containing protein [Burkholderiales bacterium]
MRQLSQSAPIFFVHPASWLLKLLRWLVLCSVLHPGLAAAHYEPGQPQTDLPRIRLSAGLHQIDAQVADQPVTRQIGLMHRKKMPQHEGMLFVFEQPQMQCFWMKNTLLPLTAAFVDDEGTIVNLVDMKPLVLDAHCSAKPVRFVLEMNQGWFAKKGLAAGSKLTGPVFQARPNR